MTTKTTLLNRTPASLSPKETPKTLEGAKQGGIGPGSEQDLVDARAEYIREAEPLGHIPPPSTMKGLAKTALALLKGEKAPVFIDKLGERLAFERVGVRLYELVITKVNSLPSWQGGPDVATLTDIRQDELAHVGLLQQCLLSIGADPTAFTPSADVAQNLSKGVPAVLADPRSGVLDCLQGLLVAELTDNASWELLLELARELDQTELAAQFERALQAEATHLARVKGWVERGTLGALHALPKTADELGTASP